MILSFGSLSALTDSSSSPAARVAEIGSGSSGEDLPRYRSGSLKTLTSEHPPVTEPSPHLLVCDHRGEGIAARVDGLREAGYRVERSESLRNTLDVLSHARPDAILVDPLTRGGSTELPTLERLRAGHPPTPVLVVADARNPLPTVLGTRALAGGLWDMIHRDAPIEEYVMRLERLRDQARRLQEMDELRHRAVHDDHTDLLRPASFAERLREHFSAADRHKLDMALLLLDLDKFGQVNKQHDHTVGDHLIKLVGDAIRRTLRAEDVAGRLGGDEFAVLLPYTRKVDAASVVQRLLAEIRALSGSFPGARGDVAVSASIGFETFDGRDLDSLETLRAHAEAALRRAKRRGGDRGVYFRNLETEAGSARPDE